MKINDIIILNAELMSEMSKLDRYTQRDILFNYMIINKELTKIHIDYLSLQQNIFYSYANKDARGQFIKKEGAPFSFESLHSAYEVLDIDLYNKEIKELDNKDILLSEIATHYVNSKLIKKYM